MLINPCTIGGATGAGIRAIAAAAAGSGLNAYDDYQKGDYLGAGHDALGVLGSLSQLFTFCFAAGTPLRTPEGHKPIEQFRVGDLVLSRPESDPDGPVRPRRVEELFTGDAFVRILTVGGRRIKTTAEHPFHVEGKGWTACKELKAGDLLAAEGGRRLAVEGVRDAGESVPVYNLRVAEDHTYFVGEDAWGFAVWSHNACDVPVHESGKGLGNPFKGKIAEEIDAMFRAKGFSPRGADPVKGLGGYVDPRTNRSYHIDPNNSFGEPPHVDVNRPRNYKGPLDKKKYDY